MVIWQLVVLGVALGFNNALAAVALGAINMKRSHQLRVALVFAFFEALMPVIGMVLGERLAVLVGGNARDVGVVILAAAGLYSLFKRDSGNRSEMRRTMDSRTFLLAMALSLDNLSVGFGLGLLDVPISLAALVFGLVSLVMTLIGLEIGRFLGSRMTISADKLSGVVLLLTAGIMFLH